MEQRVVPARVAGWPDDWPTPREINALVAVAEHGTRDAASAAIGISLGTIRSHTMSACRKVGAASAIQAYHKLRVWEDETGCPSCG